MKAEGGRRAQEGAGSGGEGRRRARTEDLESLTSGWVLWLHLHPGWSTLSLSATLGSKLSPWSSPPA